MTKLSVAYILALSVAVAACSSVPKSDQTATTAPAATTAARTASASPKLICEDSTQIGSHMSQRICLTPEQVAERRKAAQDMFNQSGHTNPCGNNPCGQGGQPPRR